MSKFVPSSDLRQETFEWGGVGWRSSPNDTGAKQIVVMDVTLAPGGGHAFHTHPDQEEVIIVKSGVIQQWLERENTTLRAGDAVYIDAGTVHGSYNDSDQPVELQVVLGPCVGEEGYVAVDVSGEEPWRSLR
jgi:quercetin dioxygenase-like cupin family protein